MSYKPQSTTERIGAAALATIGSLTAPQWLTLGELAREHTSGRLSAEAWRASASAIVERAFERAIVEGPLQLYETAGQPGRNGSY